MKNTTARAQNNHPPAKKNNPEICSDSVRTELRNFRQLKQCFKNPSNSSAISGLAQRQQAQNEFMKSKPIKGSKLNRSRNLSPIEIENPSLNTENKSLGLLSSILSPRRNINKQEFETFETLEMIKKEHNLQFSPKIPPSRRGNEGPSIIESVQRDEGTKLAYLENSASQKSPIIYKSIKEKINQNIEESTYPDNQFYKKDVKESLVIMERCEEKSILETINNSFDTQNIDQIKKSSEKTRNPSLTRGKAYTVEGDRYAMDPNLVNFYQRLKMANEQKLKDKRKKSQTATERCQLNPYYGHHKNVTNVERGALNSVEEKETFFAENRRNRSNENSMQKPELNSSKIKTRNNNSTGDKRVLSAGAREDINSLLNLKCSMIEPRQNSFEKGSATFNTKLLGTIHSNTSFLNMSGSNAKTKTISPIPKAKDSNTILSATSEKGTSGPKDQRNSTTISQEIDKWRKFGAIMADSYEELNHKFNELLKKRESDKKLNTALKEQIRKLKELLTDCQNENVMLRQEKNDRPQGQVADLEKQVREKEEQIVLLSGKHTECEKKISKFQADLIQFQGLEERMTALREENSGLIEKNKDLKKTCDARARECSSLAEEIIHLRTELDKVNQDYLKYQKIHQISLDLSGTGHQINFSLSDRKQSTREGANRLSITSSNPQFFGGIKSTPMRNSNEELKSPLVSHLRNFSSPKLNQDKITRRSGSLVPTEKGSTFREVSSSNIFLNNVKIEPHKQGSVWSYLTLENIEALTDLKKQDSNSVKGNTKQGAENGTSFANYLGSRQE